MSEITACPACGRRNRVPAAAGGVPRCGQCHSALPWIATAGDEDAGEVIGDGTTELGETVADYLAASPFDAVVADLLVAEVNRLLDGLGNEERAIVLLHFGLDRGEPRTMEEVTHATGLTRESIRMIERRALTALRRAARTSGASDLLGV